MKSVNGMTPSAWQPRKEGITMDLEKKDFGRKATANAIPALYMRRAKTPFIQPGRDPPHLSYSRQIRMKLSENSPFQLLDRMQNASLRTRADRIPLLEVHVVVVSPTVSGLFELAFERDRYFPLATKSMLEAMHQALCVWLRPRSVHKPFVVAECPRSDERHNPLVVRHIVFCTGLVTCCNVQAPFGYPVHLHVNLRADEAKL